MFPVCRRASDNLYIRVEQTALLYKERPELPRRLWREDSPELVRLGLGAATRNLAVSECGVSW
jgi:hypothetical protein